MVSTAAAGFVAGSPEQVDWAGLVWTSLGTMGAASAANTLNQVLGNPLQQAHSIPCMCSTP